MKVLHLITSLKIGGAEVALCNLLESWHKNEDHKDIIHETIFFHDGPCRSRLEKVSRVHSLKGKFSPFNIFYFWRLTKLVKKIQPDLIHSSLWSANIFSRIISYIYNIPLISDLHSDCNHHGNLRNFLDKITLVFTKRKKFLHSFVAVSSSVKKSHGATFGEKGVPVFVIENGIMFYDVPKLESKKKSDKKEFVIGTVGRLHPIKRYDLLIKSFDTFLKKVGDFSGKKPKLCFIGDGEQRFFLENLVEDLGIKNHVLFLGEKTDPYKYYDFFDCFVLSSRTEGLSIALLEAMSFGLPVVTTCEQKEHDVIEDGFNGFVVHAKKEDLLHDIFVNKFVDLYRDEVRRNEMGRRNLRLIEDRFSILRVVQQYGDLYKKKCRK